MLLRSQPKLSQSQPPKKPMNESKLPGNPPLTRHWTLRILVERRYSNLSFLGLGDTCGPCFSTASRRLNPWFAGSPRWRYVFFVKTLAPFCSPQKAGRGWKWCWYPMHSPCYNIRVFEFFDPSHIYMKPLIFSTHQGPEVGIRTLQRTSPSIRWISKFSSLEQNTQKKRQQMGVHSHHAPKIRGNW